MRIPTEPIGSIPRPLRLIEAASHTDGTNPALKPLYEELRARVLGTALAEKAIGGN